MAEETYRYYVPYIYSDRHVAATGKAGHGHAFVTMDFEPMTEDGIEVLRKAVAADIKNCDEPFIIILDWKRIF